MIFLDTSATYALADARDSNHARARRIFLQILQSGEGVLTQSYVLVEAAALLQRRLGVDIALQFLRDAEGFQVHWVTADAHHAATDLLAERGQRRLSLVDCVSFLVMRRHGVREAFAFDNDFQEEGFVLYGGS